MPSCNDSMPYPGVYRLKLPLAASPLKYVNAYLLTSPTGHLLIDTGWKTEDTALALTEQLKTCGLWTEDIARIVITHAHIDHYGMAAAVVRRSNARMMMHALEEQMTVLRYRDTRPYAQESNRLLLRSGIGQEYVPDAGEMADRFARLAEFAAPDAVWRGGETLTHGPFTFQIIWTPGHSPGHICLYEPAHRLFFSGDHVLPGITPHIGMAPGAGPNPLDDYTGSLERLAGLTVELMLPSHGPPAKGFDRRVKQILHHHRQRKTEILHIIAASAGEVNAFDLVRAMAWHARGRAASWQSLRDFDKRLALTEVMAHLVSLAAGGRLSLQERDGVDYFHLTA